MTYAEYLAAEERSEVKHEFLDGEVWEIGGPMGMAGGTPEHGRLAMNLGAEIRAALRGRPCVVRGSDVRVRIVATNRSTYPDLSVVCGKMETAPGDANAIVNPTVIAPVAIGFDGGRRPR